MTLGDTVGMSLSWITRLFGLALVLRVTSASFVMTSHAPSLDFGTRVKPALRPAPCSMSVGVKIWMRLEPVVPAFFPVVLLTLYFARSFSSAARLHGSVAQSAPAHRVLFLVSLRSSQTLLPVGFCLPSTFC